MSKSYYDFDTGTITNTLNISKNLLNTPKYDIEKQINNNKASVIYSSIFEKDKTPKLDFTGLSYSEKIKLWKQQL